MILSSLNKHRLRYNMVFLSWKDNKLVKSNLYLILITIFIKVIISSSERQLFLTTENIFQKAYYVNQWIGLMKSRKKIFSFILLNRIGSIYQFFKITFLLSSILLLFFVQTIILNWKTQSWRLNNYNNIT